MAELVRTAVSPVADDARLARLAFLCEAASRPLAAARTYRAEVAELLSGGGAAAEAAAVGVRQQWTSEPDISDGPLAQLSDAACAALRETPELASRVSPLAPATADAVAALIDAVEAVRACMTCTCTFHM